MPKISPIKKIAQVMVKPYRHVTIAWDSVSGANSAAPNPGTLGIDTNGYAWTWGTNLQFALGQGAPSANVTNTSSPQTVFAAKTWRLGQKGSTAAGGTNPAYHLLDDLSYAWGWGQNNGSIGDNTNTTRSSPVSAVGGRQWISLSALGSAVYGLDANSYAYGWGANIGDNTTNGRSSPTSVAGGRQWTVLATGQAIVHAGAIDSLSYAFMWGTNLDGQLGSNDTTAFSSPNSVVGGRQFRALSVGSSGSGSTGSFTCALDGNSYAYAWGNNGSGQLGTNNLTNRQSPVSVVGGKQFIFISASRRQTIALDGNSYAWAWGQNTNGVLGDGSTTDRSSPVSVLGGIQWKSIYIAGGDHGLGVDSSSNLWVWGLNATGQFGNYETSTLTFSSPMSYGGFGSLIPNTMFKG